MRWSDGLKILLLTGVIGSFLVAVVRMDSHGEYSGGVSQAAAMPSSVEVASQ
jgi:hypothetical protein